MALLPTALTAKAAAALTVGSIAFAGFTATRPPSPDPVKRTQQMQSQYGNDWRTRKKMARQRDVLGRSIDAERARRAVPSQQAPVRIPRILRLVRPR